MRAWKKNSVKTDSPASNQRLYYDGKANEKATPLQPLQFASWLKPCRATCSWLAPCYNDAIKDNHSFDKCLLQLSRWHRFVRRHFAVITQTSFHFCQLSHYINSGIDECVSQQILIQFLSPSFIIEPTRLAVAVQMSLPLVYLTQNYKISFQG